MRLTEAAIVLVTAVGDVRGAIDTASVSVDDVGIIGFGGEGCNSCAFGMGDGVTASFTEIEDLCEYT